MAGLENGFSQIEDGAGRFPQVAGMKVVYDPSAASGSRVVSVDVMEGETWVPLEAEKVYGVVTNNYIRNGGDGYKVFGTEAINAYDFGPDLADVVAEYLAQKGAYSPYVDGRIAVK